MINRFSEQWPSQPWQRINPWSRWLDGAANWVLFTVKCLFFFSVTSENVWFIFESLSIVIILWYTQKLRLSIQLVYLYLLVALIRWISILWQRWNRVRNTVLSHQWLSRRPLAADQIELCFFSGQHPSVNIQFTNHDGMKKVHVCSLNLTGKVKR